MRVTVLGPLSFLLVLIVNGLPTFGQNGVNLPDLIDRLRPSVFLVVSYDKFGTEESQGTGFAIGKNLVVTNSHVISEGTRFELISYDGKRFRVIQIEKSNSDKDLAVLRTSNLVYKPLVVSAHSPRVGEKIFVLGNPKGLTGSVSDGIVSAVRGGFVQITAPISPGSSGSPVFNMQGDVIGIATLDIEGGQNLNFAISSSELIRFWPPLASPEQHPSIGYDVTGEPSSPTSELISGTVELKLPDGTRIPAVGVLVEVLRADIKASGPPAKTNARGQFSFRGLQRPWTFILSISGPGIAPTYIPNIRAGQERILITVQPGDGTRIPEDEVRKTASVAKP